jgi:hypothetical protein
MAQSPKSVSIRAYNVGFGDCFLLSFLYGPKSERHVLIDFGSTGVPKGINAGKRMMEIANDIKERTDNKLHAVVATHRHKDHISGFATQKGGNGTGDVIRKLKPKVVVQPWTEDPKLKTTATGPAKKSGKGAGLLAARALHVNNLSLMQEVAQRSLDARNLPMSLRQEIQFLGETNIQNASAVKNLQTMGPNRYVFCGSKSGLEAVLPGVKIHVLGPPTVDQTATIKKQRSRDPEEFWHFQLNATRLEDSADGDKTILFPKHLAKGTRPPVEVRWLIYHSRLMRGEQLLQIVRMLDKQMNNTSVILLFQVGNKSLLFPGDAQIENWEFALSKPKFRSLLAKVDLYKVGHHGSLNATPKSLWKLFAKKSERKMPARLKSLMSTMEGKHGSAHGDTEVPRSKLVRALRQESDLFTTQELKGHDFFNDTTLSFSAGGGTGAGAKAVRGTARGSRRRRAPAA